MKKQAKDFLCEGIVKAAKFGILAIDELPKMCVKPRVKSCVKAVFGRVKAGFLALFSAHSRVFFAGRVPAFTRVIWCVKFVSEIVVEGGKKRDFMTHRQ